MLHDFVQLGADRPPIRLNLTTPRKILEPKNSRSPISEHRPISFWICLIILRPLEMTRSRAFKFIADLQTWLTRVALLADDFQPIASIMSNSSGRREIISRSE